jgi:hypothetical protein
MKVLALVGAGLLAILVVLSYGRSLWSHSVVLYDGVTADTPLPRIDTLLTESDMVPESMVQQATAVVDGVADTVSNYQTRGDVPPSDPFPTPPEPKVFLTDAQRSGLEAVGIDTSTIPQTMTPELEACFVAAIGRERVTSIVGGAMPSLKEFITAKHCIE